MKEFIRLTGECQTRGDQMRMALIGGTGLDELAWFAARKVNVVSSRFGSAEVIEGKIGGQPLFFLPRHGPSHSTPPGAINYRAQIAALRTLQVDAVIGVCATGSLTPDLPPGSFAVLADFIDMTRRRADTFFDQGPVVHTDFSQPYCPRVSDALRSGCKQAQARYESNGIYVGVEGPRYETPAEVRMYAATGAHVVGMTNVPEAILAKEAGLCYGAIAVVTNLATGLAAEHLRHDDVRASMVKSAEKLQEILSVALMQMPADRTCGCAVNSSLVI